MLQEVGLDLDVAREVTAILRDYFDDDIPSPTASALARGRAKMILRDAANDDVPLVAAIA